MDGKLNGYWLIRRPHAASSEQRRERRWIVFTVVSTGVLLVLAGVIALWLTEYGSVAAALLVFAITHAIFLSVELVWGGIGNANLRPLLDGSEFDDASEED